MYGVVTYTIWGFLPLFWRYLDGINTWELLGYRILWAFFVMTVLCMCYFPWAFLKEQLYQIFQQPSLQRNLLKAAGAIGLNWAAFIFCVSHGQTAEASFAYFLSPMFTVFFGYFRFHEVLNRGQWVAILLLCGGIITKCLLGARLALIPLVMSLAVAYYGALEKEGQIHPFIRMWVETFLLLPIVLLLMIGGMPLLQPKWTINVGLLMSGVVTALPLVLFMEASVRLPQTVLAILQYLNPLLMLGVSIFFFHEPWQAAEGWAYIWIFAGSTVFAASMVRLGWRKTE
ncbi:protein RarD [Enterococcus canis]|uniref:Protein RarD n=2 Tax=Enterococcus canis TaxID=214095 RepID=A0A1L8RFN6_9ENTE|nr:protein RarD [Enterococcus canis]